MVADTMEAAARMRPLGAVADAVRRMVHAAWVRADLYGDDGKEGEGEDQLTVYDVVVSGNRIPPCFA